MQMTLDAMSRLNKMLVSNHRSSNEMVPTEDILKEANKLVKVAFEKNVFETALLDYFLQIGTLLRRGNPEIRRWTLAFFKTFELIGKPILSDNNSKDKEELIFSQFSANLRFILFETLKKISHFQDFNELGANLVWKDEKDKINKLLASITPTDTKSVNEFYKKYQVDLSKFVVSGKLENLESSIKKIHSLKGKSSDKEIKKKAGQVLSYLVLENDIISDTLGVFGLADDLQVINDFLTEVDASNASKRLLTEFLNFNDNPLSIFYERELDRGDNAQNFGNIYKALTPSSSQITFILATLNYVSETEKKRILAIVPDQQIIGFLYLLNFLLENRISPLNEREKYFEVGETVYFNLPRMTIAVKYMGRNEQNSNLIELGNIEDSIDNTRVSLSPYALNFGSRICRSKKIREDVSLIDQWKKKVDFVPSHIIFEQKDRKVFYLTQKNKFEEIKKTLKPYGANLSHYIDFQYRDYGEEDGSDNSIYTSAGKRPRVFIFPDADQLHEILFEINDKENVVIICDEPRLASRFEANLHNKFGYDKIQLIFIMPSEETFLIENLNKKNFSNIYLTSHLNEIKSGSKNIKFSDPISRYEEKLEKATKKILINFHDVNSEIYQNFTTILVQIFRRNREGVHIVSEEIIRRVLRIRDVFFRCWLPFHSEDKPKYSNLLDETLDFIQPQIGDNESLSLLYNLIKLERENFFQIFQKRKVIPFLQKSSNMFYILEEHATARDRSNHFLRRNGVFNAECLTVSDIRGRYLSASLVIPYQLGQSKLRYLSQINTASSLEFFLFKDECKDFDIQKRRSEKAVNKLRNSTKKTFEDTNAYKIFNEIQIETFEEKDEYKVISDYEKEIVRSQINRIGLVEDSHRDINKEIDALPILLNDNRKVIFLAYNSRVITSTKKIESELKQISFNEQKARDLTEGDRIYIPAGSKTDMFEALAKTFTPKYVDQKVRATSWKRELKNIFEGHCKCNLQKFNTLMSGVGVNRKESTLKNWLFDDLTIGPKNYKLELEKFRDLPVSNQFLDSLTSLNEEISKCYELKKENSSKVIEVMNNPKHTVVSETDVRIGIRNANLIMNSFEVSLVEDTVRIEIEKLWKVNDL